MTEYQPEASYGEQLRSRESQVVTRNRAISQYMEQLNTQLLPNDDRQRKGLGKRLLFLLRTSLDNPEIVDPHLLIDYAIVLSRVMVNLGLARDYLELIDRILQVSVDIQYLTSPLYLAKYTYLNTFNIESKECEVALQAAFDTAVDDKERIEAMIAKAHYYNNNSRYPASIQLFQECLAFVEGKTDFRSFEAESIIWIGANYFTLLNYPTAKEFLNKGNELAVAINDLRQQSTALHYLGRVALAEGHTKDTMQYYLESQACLERSGPLEPHATAFFHLRIAQLLLSSGLIQQAEDHLALSQQYFVIEQSHGSALIQTELEWAQLEAGRGQLRQAEQRIERTIADVRRSQYPRGELLCLVVLFWIQFKHFRWHRALYTLFRALRTWRDGEIGKGGGFRLVWKYLTSVLLYPIKRLFGQPHTIMMAGNAGERLASCMCPLHKPQE
jgi:tetratricopeptide (TPR) repeat protein